MNIRLWSREHGLVRAPQTQLYAEVGRHDFPETFRKRAGMWAATAFQRIEFGTPQGEVVNRQRRSWELLYEGLCDAYGRSPLVNLGQMAVQGYSKADISAESQLGAHLLICPDNEVLDFVSGVFQISSRLVDDIAGAEAAEEEAQAIGPLLNAIFEEEGIGYRWVAGQIIRFDEPVTHDLAIEPAMELLHDGAFGHANREFAAAMEAYRSGRWRDSITNANAAFESVLKIRTGKPNLTAGDLIHEAKRQGVIPAYLGAATEHLEKLMHIAPAVRGQEAAHGLANRPSGADQHLAQLVVSITAAFVLFIGRPAAFDQGQ
jgi:hypothetical protein